jgi:hypothetical protein
MSAGASDACEREELDYDIAVQFDAGDYLEASLNAILDGTLTEGGRMVFEVGVYDKVGAKFCDATPEQEAALQEVRDGIAAGEYDELFGEIQAEAFGGAATPDSTDAGTTPATTSE